MKEEDVDFEILEDCLKETSDSKLHDHSSTSFEMDGVLGNA